MDKVHLHRWIVSPTRLPIVNVNHEDHHTCLVSIFSFLTDKYFDKVQESISKSIVIFVMYLQ